MRNITFFRMEGEIILSHLHITAWALAIILLIVVTVFYQSGKNKPGKILHMILRLDYLLILYTGGSLFADYATKSSGELYVKVVAGLLAIVAMELITVRTSKGKPTGVWWTIFIVAAAIAIVLGFFRL